MREIICSFWHCPFIHYHLLRSFVRSISICIYVHTRPNDNPQKRRHNLLPMIFHFLAILHASTLNIAINCGIASNQTENCTFFAHDSFISSDTLTFAANTMTVTIAVGHFTFIMTQVTLFSFPTRITLAFTVDVFTPLRT